MTEEERAAQFRADSAARLQAAQARAARLQGNAGARARLAAAWQPVVDWIAERQMSRIPTAEELQQERTDAHRQQVASLPGLTRLNR